MPWRCFPVLTPIPPHVGPGIVKHVRWRMRHGLGLSHHGARRLMAASVACVFVAPVAAYGGARAVSWWVAPAPYSGVVVAVPEPSSGALFILPALFVVLLVKGKAR